MQVIFVLLAVYVSSILVILPIWTYLKITGLEKANQRLRLWLAELESEMRTRNRATSTPLSAPPATPISPVAVSPLETPAPAPAPAAKLASPPVIVRLPHPPAPAATATPPAMVPPPTKSVPLAYTPGPARRWSDTINWELFMGAKLFAWLGGLALFLGVAFFVKYSFEHDLIPPEVRVALGFLLGTGLIVGGLRIDRSRYVHTAQSLIAAGVVSLYAVTFACNSVYHFALFSLGPTFLLMALITTTAFLLAVRLRAPVVALLGMLGGFLTPILLSTGVDNPAGFFGYLALLDAGLVAVALRTGWTYLVPLGAGGTMLLLLGWTDRFFTPAKGPVAMTVCLGFGLLFQAAAALARRRARSDRFVSWTAVAVPLVGLGYALFFLGYGELAARAPLYLGFVLLLDGLLLWQAWSDDTLPHLHFASGLGVFALLARWTGEHLTEALLLWALIGYLVFAALHTAFPHLLARRRPASAPVWWSQVFPPLTLLLMFFPILKLSAVSFMLWPAVLLVDVLAVGLALVGASLAGVAAVLVLTFVVTSLCIFRAPVDVVFAPSLFLVIGGFTLFFFAVCLWLVRKLGDRCTQWTTDARLLPVFGDARAQLPAFSSLLPFLLLVMVCARLPVPDPSLVFGLGLLLVVLTLGLARLLVIEWLPACALAGVALLQYAWHGRHFLPATPGGPLAWYLAFNALFIVYPFVFRRSFFRLTGPWAVSALAGPVHFLLVYRTVERIWPNDLLGLLPALFALPPLVGLAAVWRTTPADSPARLGQLAWFGGVALGFISLIFPIQFERQWLTLGWAFEGAALLWLFHRVPHPGLRATGVGLLIAAFARLALNGAVLSYHARSATPIFNWYLYTYGLAAAALFLGARLLAPPREQVCGRDARPLLHALGTVLVFLLLNIEIADFFTPAGARTLTFRFSGDFARDMTYTIAWALFALGLLGAGLWRRQRPVRYAALGLLSVALLKLFLHDLAHLQALYRIGALFAVAIIAILASFAYQRFLPSRANPPSA